MAPDGQKLNTHTDKPIDKTDGRTEPKQYSSPFGGG